MLAPKGRATNAMPFMDSAVASVLRSNPELLRHAYFAAHIVPAPHISRHTQVRGGLCRDSNAAAAAGGARHAAGRGLPAPDRVPALAPRPPAGVRATLVTGVRSSGADQAQNPFVLTSICWPVYRH